MSTVLILTSKRLSLYSKLYIVVNHSTRKFSSGCSQKRPLDNCRKEVLWKKVLNQAFGKYMILTNTVSAACLMAIGDLIQQEVRCYKEGKQMHTFDWKRNKNMATIGFLQGPAMHIFYSLIDKYLPGNTLIQVAKKIFIDQAIGSPFFIITFFIGSGLLNDQNLKETIEELEQKFFTVYGVDCLIWIPVQFINFFWVSNKFRVIYVNMVVMCYNVFLSFMKYDVDA